MREKLQLVKLSKVNSVNKKTASLVWVLIAVNAITFSAQAQFFSNLFNGNGPSVGTQQAKTTEAGAATNVDPNATTTSSVTAVPVAPPAHIPTEAELKLKNDREAPTPPAPWVVRKEQWDEADELEYSQFIHKLGIAVQQKKCGSVDACLKNPTINTYYDAVVDQGFHYSDCADLPYYLRAYFAYKKSLPFAYGSSIEANPPETPEEQAEWDAKIAKNENPAAGTKALFGNHVVSRSQVPAGDGKSKRDFFTYSFRLADGVSSGAFRTFRKIEGALLPDTYIPRIEKGVIKPGAITYKVAGHVGVVYDISEKGDIKVLDAHPDNTLTVKKLWEIYEPSRSAHGSPIQMFRPVKLVGAKLLKDGTYVGGKVVLAEDEELPASNEALLGSAPESGKRVYLADGERLGFLDFVRARLATGDPRTYPVEDFKDRMQELCNKFIGRIEMIEGSRSMSEKDRAEFFNVTKELSNQDHRGVLPPNIYNASGEWQFWEDRSTPGRDGDIRLAVLDTANMAKDLLDRSVKPDKFFSYKGDAPTLKVELIRAYHQQVAQCQIRYTRSDDSKVRISLSEAIRRLPKMSFDVYHCLERKAGATDPKELATCKESETERQIYEAEAYLRQRTERSAEQMGYDLAQLQQLNQENYKQGLSFDLEKLLTGLTIKKVEK